MDFDEHEEEQKEEIDMQHQMEAGNSGSSSAAVVSVGSAKRNGGGVVHYKECLKNHAVGIGGHAVDGCCEFMAAGEEGTLEALKCAACNCHRNFHRKVLEGDVFHQSHHTLPPPPPPLSSSNHHHPFMAHSIRSPHPMGYLHVTPSQQPLGLPSREEEDDMSNPSSSGGGGGGGGVKRRFRTKFTQEQKEKMGAFAEKLGWRIQKEDEAAVEQFCAENNLRGHVFKVWMHNNKQTLGPQYQDNDWIR